MTYVYPGQSLWNGPFCPHCGRGYIQPAVTWTTTTTTYQPRHRKPGPAQ